METYLTNIVWCIFEAYWQSAIIVLFIGAGFNSAVLIIQVHNFIHIDIMDDFVGPLLVGILIIALISTIWPFTLALLLMIGINLIILIIVKHLIIPLYKFLKSLPLLDFRRGVDNG